MCSLAELRAQRPHLLRLRDAARLARRVGLFLDIKDRQICKSDLEAALRGLPWSVVYVAAHDVDYLAELGTLQRGWHKVYNVGLLWPRTRLAALQRAGVYAVELFFLDFTPQTIRLVRGAGMRVALSSLILPRHVYVAWCTRRPVLWVAVDDLPCLPRRVVARGLNLTCGDGICARPARLRAAVKGRT